jgi:hypothetical protein
MVKDNQNARAKYGANLLALGIAFRMQEKELRGLPFSQVRELAKLSEYYAQTGEIGTSDSITLKIGSRLVREWHGETHHVMIADHDINIENADTDLLLR